MNYLNKSSKIIKGHLFYSILKDKKLTHDEKKNKIAYLNKLLQDNTILLEFINVAINVLNKAKNELEKRR